MFHYTEKPIIKFTDTTKTLRSGFKPDGLWFAKDREWLDWCDNAGFYPQDYRYAYEILDLGTTRILYIEPNIESCKKFCLDFFVSKSYSNLEVGNLIGEIDWKKIGEKYDGIWMPKMSGNSEIKSIPGWLIFCVLDVDSMCIWNPSNIFFSEPQEVINQNF